MYKVHFNEARARVTTTRPAVERALVSADHTVKHKQ